MTQVLVPVGVVLGAVALAVVVRAYGVFVTRVRSWSMAPTLHPGQRLWTRRVHKAARLGHGDIVVIDSAEIGDVIIKRLLGVPGDRVTIDRSGNLSVNGRAVAEPYVTDPVGPAQAFDVPDGHLFVLGDNRRLSSDSRTWQQPFVPTSAVLGRAIRTGKARP